jgi:hypothetical protein
MAGEGQQQIELEEVRSTGARPSRSALRRRSQSAVQRKMAFTCAELARAEWFREVVAPLRPTTHRSISTRGQEQHVHLGPPRSRRDRYRPSPQHDVEDDQVGLTCRASARAASPFSATCTTYLSCVRYLDTRSRTEDSSSTTSTVRPTTSSSKPARRSQQALSGLGGRSCRSETDVADPWSDDERAQRERLPANTIAPARRPPPRAHRSPVRRAG